jgi:hypothetical protein
MREIRSSGSVEGVMSNHDPYSDRKRRSDFIPASSLACDSVRNGSEA